MSDNEPTERLLDVFNLYNDELDNSNEREGWNFRAAKVGEHIGGELIGAGLYEAEPGNKVWPYHTHHANEEWLLVVRGQPTLRTPEGERQLNEGDVVCFPRGKAGAHQVWNGSDSPIRVLMLSTLVVPDIVEFLDTGKVSARSVAGELIMFGRRGPSSTTGKARSSWKRAFSRLAPSPARTFRAPLGHDVRAATDAPKPQDRRERGTENGSDGTRTRDLRRDRPAF